MEEGKIKKFVDAAGIGQPSPEKRRQVAPAPFDPRRGASELDGTYVEIEGSAPVKLEKPSGSEF